MKVQRNDPCPCGSGKKYKKCCENKEMTIRSSELKPERFHYKSGSYGGPGRCYMPSIFCYKEEGDKLIEHFCLICPSEVYDEEDDALEKSSMDLEKAKKAQLETNSVKEFAISLRHAGYLSLSDYHVVGSDDAFLPSGPSGSDQTNSLE